MAKKTYIVSHRAAAGEEMHSRGPFTYDDAVEVAWGIASCVFDPVERQRAMNWTKRIDRVSDRIALPGGGALLVEKVGGQGRVGGEPSGDRGGDR